MSYTQPERRLHLTVPGHALWYKNFRNFIEEAVCVVPVWLRRSWLRRYRCRDLDKHRLGGRAGWCYRGLK